MSCKQLFPCVVFAVATASIASAQTITSPASTVSVTPADDFATRVMQDPWDMNQRTDLGWFTFGNDLPNSNLTGMEFTGGQFLATPANSDPNFWLLDPPTYGRTRFGKDGQTYPIDTSRYRRLMIRMSLANSASADGQILFNVTRGEPFFGDVIFPTVTQGWRVYVIDMNSSVDWTGLVDSLRVDPTQNVNSGQIRVDWARLVDTTRTANTITWSGAGSFDIFISDTAGCGGNVAKIGLNRSGGSMSFYAAGLPPGDWYVGMAASGASTPTTCSTGFFRVSGVPTIGFTAPSDEGSTDDFAFAQLGGDTWDPIDANDIDFSRGIAGLGNTTVAAQTEAGISLGNIAVLSGTSTAGDGSTGQATCSSVTFNVGDPHVYPLWYQPLPGVRGRGATTQIDTSRYRILTFEQAIPRARDLCRGSVARVVWKVKGEPQENVTSDILLHHLDPNDTVSPNLSPNNVQMFQKITLDLADRTTVPVDPGSPAQSGWVNTLDNFRIDFHEFGDPTAFFLRRVKLAALEQADTSYQIRMAFSNPSNASATVSFFADTDGSGFDGAAISGCQDVTPSSTTTCTWNTTSLSHGTLRHVYAVVRISGTVVNQLYAKWPIRIFHPGSVPPTLTVDHSTLRFNVVRGATATPSQNVTLGQSGGSGTLSWTASSNASWLNVSPASGSGARALTVSLNSADSALQNFGTYSGRITIPASGSNTVTVDVTLTVVSSGSTSPPFGQVDTPVQNATGVQGAIGVTGWALDDVAVSGVKIYRSCVASDAPGACQNVGGHNTVFVGDAAFVPGARSDLEAAFPNNPQNYLGGWGYLMLTNMLPNVTRGLSFGGQGTLTIYAFATDVEGHRRLLGRAYTGAGSSDPTVITMANESIAKPFGAIDTPGQGQTVSGMLANFGWALTPDSNTSAGAGDIVIPTNGSTMTVVIDGAAAGTVAYNQCRGSVGNPVPGGSFCDDDVANIFGNPTPQPPFTVRTSNPTLFRNLDAGRAAIGAFDINTALLANGRHSIAWGVTDTMGRAEGIGSRDFIVLNGGSLVMTEGVSQGVPSAMLDAPARVVGLAADVVGRLVRETVVRGRTGFDFRRSYETVVADPDGVRRLTIPELGRLELWLGAHVTTGYLKAGDILRSLPPGSRLDAGVFTWSPIVGYVGPYELYFVDDDANLPITVTIVPATQPDVGQMHGYIDAPQANAVVSRGFSIGGWAMDLRAWTGSGVGAVHVWAQRLDQPGVLAQFLGAADIGIERPDVAVAFGPGGRRAGWNLTPPTDLDRGSYEITAYFWSTRTARFEDARTSRVTVK